MIIKCKNAAEISFSIFDHYCVDLELLSLQKLEKSQKKVLTLNNSAMIADISRQTDLAEFSARPLALEGMKCLA